VEALGLNAERLAVVATVRMAIWRPFFALSLTKDGKLLEAIEPPAPEQLLQ
jgi:hypothetical protein